jgi:hypothetical protein
VEVDIGWFRRNRLVPVPDVGSLAELNALISSGTSRMRHAGSVLGSAAADDR